MKQILYFCRTKYYNSKTTYYGTNIFKYMYKLRKFT